MSLGALTATFSPPASCTESFGHAYLLGTQFAPTYYGPATTDGCFPRNYIAARDAYYSPGVCPAAYTSACSSTNVIGSLTETAITCCPTGFDCNTQLEFSWETTLLCSSSYALTTTQTIPVTFLGTRGSIVRISTDTAATAGGMNAFGYQVRFQSTDFQPVSLCFLLSAVADQQTDCFL
ncbi:hypothetical protein QBC47DRAFT_309067 [Echria macrotheca]|uniref:Uncharacterized protein n=1 Tax=Echria macrotheca TaxID=438768 RepID=A0AAJ0B3K4_9PEZI|nr:hypothetical protein QBC47DRAFT_309067 [Echria macrotheca]